MMDWIQRKSAELILHAAAMVVVAGAFWLVSLALDASFSDIAGLFLIVAFFVQGLRGRLF